jgi:hypothetical protein
MFIEQSWPWKKLPGRGGGWHLYYKRAFGSIVQQHKRAGGVWYRASACGQVKMVNTVPQAKRTIEQWIREYEATL